MKLQRHLLGVAALAIGLLAGPISASADSSLASVAVGAQYDTTHVYVSPDEVDVFVNSFTATFGGKSTAQFMVTVTPTPSSTSSQLIQTPSGTVSLFGFRTPVPFPFGSERTGYLVSDMSHAVKAARAAGAELVVAPFKDPIGTDAVIAWPGGVMMQLYTHDKKPSYDALATVPENRVYVSADRADEFVEGFLRFSSGKITQDVRHADGAEIGRAGTTYRRLRLASGFGKMQVLVTDGHLPYPFGREITGYEVDDLEATLGKARAAGVEVLVEPFVAKDRQSAMVMFPGGYVAEIHALLD